MTAILCRREGGGVLRSAIWRNGSQFFANFRKFPHCFRNCFLFVQLRAVGALCVPCADMLLLEALGGLVAALQFSRNFPAVFRDGIRLSLTAIHPLPPPDPCYLRVMPITWTGKPRCCYGNVGTASRVESGIAAMAQETSQGCREARERVGEGQGVSAAQIG